MRRLCFWIAAWLAIGLSGCTTLQPSRPDTAKACASWRWIGISRPEARCPEVLGWKVRPLFPQLAPAQDYCDLQALDKVPSRQVIQELNRFCVYEIDDPKKRLDELPFPPAASNDLERFDADCAALAGVDEKLEEKAAKPGARPFFSEAGELRPPVKIDNRQGVRLAFLDTQPNGEGVPESPGRSPHGYALSKLAERLVCAQGPSGHCAAQITTRLALPIIDFDPKNPLHNVTDTVRGGFIGMQSDLADAIRSEVDSWRQEKLQKHLVLNLSLAWDGDLFGGLDEQRIAEMRAGTQAVYRAIQYAAGYDVLVLAAAGNRKREPCQNYGPLLPAAWERGAPKEEGCPESQKWPILYGVGGVQSDGHPLGNARPGGMPLRAAYGENEPTAHLTGSSVATAVVSSIAAVVWDIFPEKRYHEIMKILDASGDQLPLKADFWFRSSAPPDPPFPIVHRLSLCAALQKACVGNTSEACLIQCETWQPEAFSSRRDAGPVVLGSCQPWLYPQPEDPPCPICIKDPPLGK